LWHVANLRFASSYPFDSFILYTESDFCVKEKYEKHSEPTETETKTKDSDESTDEAKDKGKDYCTSSDPCGECYGKNETYGYIYNALEYEYAN
jgi:hypothetical protein